MAYDGPDFLTAYADPRELRQFERRMEDIGSKRIPRAAQFAINGVAIDAVKKSRPMLEKEMDRPVPWLVKSMVADLGKLGAVTSLADVSSAMRVKDKQSAILKYMLGEDDGEVARRPGDVGPAQQHILIPVWRNLERMTTTKKNARGNLKRNALDKLFSGASMRNDQGVFWGAPTIRGQQMPLGLWARPERTWLNADGSRWQARDERGRFTNSVTRGRGMRRANMGLPEILLLAKQRTEHKKTLNEPTEKVARAAMGTLGDRLAAELRSQLARKAGLASVRARNS